MVCNNGQKLIEEGHVDAVNILFIYSLSYFELFETFETISKMLSAYDIKIKSS